MAVFLLLINNGFCQSVLNNNENRRIDSLKTELTKTLTNENYAQTNLQLGITLYQHGKFDEAKLYLNKTIELSKLIHNQSLTLKSYNNLGNIEADMGNNPQALSYYQSALKIAEQTNDLKYIAHINKNIGALFVSWKRFEESLSYYHKAENAAIKFKDSLLFADCNNNIGIVYEQQNKYDLAIEYYSKALTIYNQYHVLDGIAMSYSNLAIVYKLKKDFYKSIECNLKSIEISKQLGDKWAEAATLNNIGNLYGQLGDYSNAKSYCNQSLKLAQEINAPEIIYNIYESLSDAAYKANDIENTQLYHKLFVEAKEKFNNIEVNKQLSELNIKYEAEKKQRENDQLQFENDNTTKQRNWIIGVSILIVFVILIVFMIIQKTQKAKQYLQQQKAINEASFETEQQERERIARDLHDSVGQKLSVVKMQLSMKNADVNASSKLLDEAIQDVRDVSHNLMPLDLRDGFINAIKQITEQINYSSPKTKIELNVSESFVQISFTKQIQLTLYRIIQEIINNSLKYAQAENITVAMNYQNKLVTIMVKDNGIGFNIEDKKEGIGIKNINMRVLQLKGKLVIESVKNNGTTFTITFKKES